MPRVPVKGMLLREEIRRGTRYRRGRLEEEQLADERREKVQSTAVVRGIEKEIDRSAPLRLAQKKSGYAISERGDPSGLAWTREAPAIVFKRTKMLKRWGRTHCLRGKSRVRSWNHIDRDKKRRIGSLTSKRNHRLDLIFGAGRPGKGGSSGDYADPNEMCLPRPKKSLKGARNPSGTKKKKGRWVNQSQGISLPDLRREIQTNRSQFLL